MGEIKAHRRLGPGLLESVYEAVLRADLLFDGLVLVELDSVEHVLTYIRRHHPSRQRLRD